MRALTPQAVFILMVIIGVLAIALMLFGALATEIHEIQARLAAAQ